MAAVETRRVLILGGYGSYGRLIAEALAADSRAASPQLEVRIAGRDLAKAVEAARQLGATSARCDASDPASLRAAIAGAFLVINAAGPFQAEDYAIPSQCVAAGCNYIDLGDGRAYVAGVQRLDAAARERGVFACLGASTTPAVTSAMVAALQPGLGRIREIKIALNAGNRNRAGVSTIASILSYVGLPVRVWRAGRWQHVLGWGEGEFIDFPAPVGRRRVQVCDVPDHELFPQLFGAESVTFKAGVELTMLNYAISALGIARGVAPGLDLPRLAPLLVRLSGLFKTFGTLHGACGVWVTDQAGRERRMAFVAPSNGPRLPAAPSVLLARRLIREGVFQTGACPCVGLLSVDDFAAHLASYGIGVVRPDAPPADAAAIIAA
jgi:hypothetical protein